jgi:hypothetical protein
MPPFAYFGIESSGLNLIIDLLILFAVVLYLALIYWTYADARRRIVDPMLIGCSVAASVLFPYVGTIVYMIVRPPEYLEDVHEREIETQAAEARLREVEYGRCPHCDYPTERDFVRCPSCLRKLKDRCASCSRPLDHTWTICPYCEAEIPGTAASRRGLRRRTRGLEGDRAEIRSASASGGDGSADAELSEIGGSAARGTSRGKRTDDDALPAPRPAPEPPAPRSGRASRPGGRARPSSS